MQTISLDQAVQEYLLDCRVRQLSRKTLRQYEDNLRLFREFSPSAGRITGRFGDRLVGSFDKRDVVAFMAGLDDVRKAVSRDVRKARIDVPVGKITRHAYARALRAFWRWAFKEEYIEKPVVVEMPRVPIKEIPVLRDDEVERILAVARRHKDEGLRQWRDYVIPLLLAYSGARRAEILDLRVEDLDFEAEPPVLVIQHGKGDKQRRVVMHRDIRAELLRYTRMLRRHEIEWVIFSDRIPTKRLVDDALNRIVKAFAKEAGVDPTRVSAHKWRHSFCSRLANNGVNLAVVQDLAGHSDIATTRRYVTTTPEAQAAALESLSLGRKRKGR